MIFFIAFGAYTHPLGAAIVEADGPLDAMRTAKRLGLIPNDPEIIPSSPVIPVPEQLVAKYAPLAGKYYSNEELACLVNDKVVSIVDRNVTFAEPRRDC